jgi:hypothetical protein
LTVTPSRIPVGARSATDPPAATGADAADPSGTESGRTETGRTETGGAALTGSPLRVGLLVSRARAAARSGELDEALRLLLSADDPALGGHRDVLDLLARVHAQRGELTEAAAYWRRVQERHPRDPAATAGLARIERLGRGGPRAVLSRHRSRTALAAVVCVVAAATAGTVALTDGTEGGRAARHSASAQHSASPAEQAQRIARHLEAGQRAAVAREASRAAARRAAAARALARTLRAPGLHPEVRGDRVEVVFTEGLFSTAAELTPAGADRLAALGRRLAGQEARVEVYGQAATVPGAPRSGGSVLSLWRALIAARELSTASGKPLTAFTTASADQRDAPYEDAARNRTVTVVITPGK